MPPERVTQDNILDYLRQRHSRTTYIIAQDLGLSHTTVARKLDGLLYQKKVRRYGSPHGIWTQWEVA